MRLKNKTIIIVGASGGIGSVLTKQFHKEGANIGLVARTKSKLDALSNALGNERLLSVETDATNPASMKAAFDACEGVFQSSIDAVIIAAGTWMRTTVDEEVNDLLSQSQKAYQSFFLSTLIPAFIAQQYFTKKSKGLIVHISSHAAVRADLPGNLLYGPMKSAASRLIHGIQYELNNTGVRLVDILPAIVNTIDNEILLKTEDAKKLAVKPEDIAEWIIDHIDDPNIPQSIQFNSDVILD